MRTRPVGQSSTVTRRTADCANPRQATQPEGVRHGDLDTRSDLLSIAPHGDAGAGRRARLCGGVRSRTRRNPTASPIVDVDPTSPSYSKIVGTVAAPNAGDEFHHFGWNACSSCLCPQMPHPHVERRYLVVPGLRSSRIYILDTKPDPRNPKIVKVIEPQEIAEKTGYTRPHTVHCGPGGIYVAALGNKDGKAPGGVFVMDHETFEPLGRWEVDRGPQQLAYDAWWHLGHDTMVTSEWGTPDTFENGLVPGGAARQQVRPQAALLGSHQAQAPAGDRLRRGASAGVRAAPRARPDQGVRLRELRDQPEGSLVVDLDLVSRRRQVGGEEDHHASRPSRRAPTCCRRCSRASAPARRWSPTSISRWTTAFSMCRAGAPATCSNTTSPIRSIPSSPARCGSAASCRAPAIRRAKNGKLSGGPQMVEVSRDGRRVYFTNSLYGAIDPQFYEGGFDGWMVKLEPRPMAASRSIRNSSSNGRRATCRTRCGCRAATARRTRTAIRERHAAPLWPWLALAGLGLFHGINPAMGWLFAVGARAAARQRASPWSRRCRRSRSAMPPRLRSRSRSSPCARSAIDTCAAARRRRRLPDRLRRLALARGYRHQVRVGMQVGFVDLALWSFLMATAHGAGLMVMPVLLELPAGDGIRRTTPTAPICRRSPARSGPGCWRWWCIPSRC